MTKRPASTYRLQIQPAFDLDAAAQVAPYLADLGADWAYLSPLLRATEGSEHGYDVVDPSLVDPARGGRDGLDRFAAAARSTGLGILIDIVPNHMGIARPAQNPWWWDVLTHGRDSRYADAFDIDWDFGAGRVRVPILGAPLDVVLAEGDVKIDPDVSELGAHGVVRFYGGEHVLPLAPDSVPFPVVGLGSAPLDDPRVLRQILERQHWEAVFWRREAAELNYRRFFAITTLAGLRVELPWVFEESHAEVLRWVRDGIADGLRIDHPDGLLDPGGYLEQLDAALQRAQAPDTARYVLIEKILEHGEELPAWWETDGTTGYDALADIDRVLIDPDGEATLEQLDAHLRGGATADYHQLIHETKRMIADTVQSAEVARLVRSLPQPVDHAADALAELLACFPVYRSYLPAGRAHLEEAAAQASARRPDLAESISRLVPSLADATLEVARRFQQTTGPVMAKGVEDTAFYRYTRLGSLTEVGGDPSVFSLPVEGFHRAQAARQSSWPDSMTALTTHDTKRAEDARARLDVLAEMPERWTRVLADLRSRASTGHGPFDSLLYQAVIGSWPASRERLHGYVEKAAREAAEATSWWDPDAAFEGRVRATVDAVFDDAAVAELTARFVAEIAPAGWSNGLAAKLLQLTAPGVPDVYQGSELWQTSLVDPDNRRPVDFDERRRMLAGLDAGFARGELPPVDASGAAKLLVTSRALRLRRDSPELFTRYTPMTVVGDTAQHAIAFDRGGALTVATRLPVGLAARGGWGETVLLRHSGPTTDALTGRTFEGSSLGLADLLATYPVALLVPAQERRA